ncbi:MAG TPA: hypothetical protein VGJ18_28090 [Gemmatimonadaceae bacterium]
MSLSRRMLARAGVLAIGALTLAACSDSSTAPLNITPDQLQSMGSSVATEIEGSMAELTAQDVMNTNGGAPTFSRVPRTTVAMMRGLAQNRYGLSFNRYASNASASDISTCGVASQTPPVDTDGDGVPDNFNITFSLPACHFADATSSYDVTGALNISDPQPGTSGMALDFGLQNFKITFNGSEGGGYVSRNGTASVSVSQTGLYQSSTWTDNAVLTGVTSASDNIHWTNSFTAAQGQSITAGRELPDGAYSPSGSVNFQQGNRVASFSVTTIDPLQYSASCAAGVQQGTSLSPFTSGHIRVAVTNQTNSGYADITYSGCNSATVTLVAGQ